MLANLSTLAALCALAPLSLGVCFGRHAGLVSEVDDDARRNVLAAIREAAIELEGFEQHGADEPVGAGLVAEQFTFIRGERLVLVEFVGVPIPLHGSSFQNIRLFAEAAYSELSGVF